VLVHQGKPQLSTTLCDTIVKSAQKSLSARGVFTLALSGGSIPKMLSTDNMIAAFARHSIEPSFENWHVFLADERIVPSTSPDSNMLSLQTDGFLSPPSSIPPPTSYPIIDSSDNTPSEVSSAYQNILTSILTQSYGKFDTIVCGMGEDGHTCSLFPNHELVRNQSDNFVDFIIDSPKQPPERITLTFKVLNEARSVIFAAAGGGKSDVLQKVFKKGEGDDSEFPCAMVSPSEGELLWLVDVAAA
ncbi:hypothetical protein TL16_g10059, partial [Triparma laevis f. inornata]